jgi:hypothetical protein
MSDATEQPKKERFAPKQPVTLNPPKDDVIERDYLAKCDGTNDGFPTLVAIKGDVFDVSGKETYAPGKGYHGSPPLKEILRITRANPVCQSLRGKSPIAPLGFLPSSLKIAYLTTQSFPTRKSKYSTIGIRSSASGTT